MRTARLLPVSPSMHCAGGGACLWSWGVCVCVCVCVYSNMQWGRPPPVNRMTHRCKKRYLAPNFVCGRLIYRRLSVNLRSRVVRSNECGQSGNNLPQVNIKIVLFYAIGKSWNIHNGYDLVIIITTRMHSSRVRTVRCSDRHWGGCLPARGCLPGSCLPAGVCPAVVSSCRWVCLPDPLPPWKEWQTHVKTLPCRNYIADGYDTLMVFNINVSVPYDLSRL